MKITRPTYVMADPGIHGVVRRPSPLEWVVDASRPPCKSCGAPVEIEHMPGVGQVFRKLGRWKTYSTRCSVATCRRRGRITELVKKGKS